MTYTSLVPVLPISKSFISTPYPFIPLSISYQSVQPPINPIPTVCDPVSKALGPRPSRYASTSLESSSVHSASSRVILEDDTGNPSLLWPLSLHRSLLLSSSHIFISSTGDLYLAALGDHLVPPNVHIFSVRHESAISLPCTSFSIRTHSPLYEPRTSTCRTIRHTF